MQNLPRKEASAYLKDKFGISYKPSTLAKAAVVGGGPPFLSDGRKPLYPINKLDAWALKRLGPLRCSTSDGANDDAEVDREESDVEVTEDPEDSP